MPQFYLRGFAAGDRLATIQLPGTKRFVQSVHNAASVTDFYRIAGHEDGDDIVEKALSELESDAANVLAKISSGTWPLDVEDREALGMFIAVQATRVPSQRHTLDFMATQLLRLQVGASGRERLRLQLEELHGRPIEDLELDESWESFTRAGGPPIRLSSEAFAVQMLKLADEIVKYIVGRPWCLVALDRRSLLTSDTPVGLIARPDDDQWQGLGYLTAYAISFPLTRKLGLMMLDITPLAERDVPVEMVRQGRLDTRQEGTTALERTINHSTVTNAAEWLFHHPDDDRFVPAPLPDARPVKMTFGGPESFTGDAWFAGPEGTDA